MHLSRDRLQVTGGRFPQSLNADQHWRRVELRLAAVVYFAVNPDDRFGFVLPRNADEIHSATVAVSS